jgi:hypothetical protein
MDRSPYAGSTWLPHHAFTRHRRRCTHHDFRRAVLHLPEARDWRVARARPFFRGRPHRESSDVSHVLALRAGRCCVYNRAPRDGAFIIQQDTESRRNALRKPNRGLRLSGATFVSRSPIENSHKSASIAPAVPTTSAGRTYFPHCPSVKCFEISPRSAAGASSRKFFVKCLNRPRACLSMLMFQKTSVASCWINLGARCCGSPWLTLPRKFDSVYGISDEYLSVNLFAP